MLFQRASQLGQDEYDVAVANALSAVYDHRDPEKIQLASLHAVVISDLHRGARDGADDFERAEAAYGAALGSYLERGYELWLLGDVEELWENDIDEVVPGSYRELLDLEGQFASVRGGPGLRRFWGNHDLDWKDSEKVGNALGQYLPGVTVAESLRLEVADGDVTLGTLFLAHGHQGTDFSERFAWLSRFFVRRVWRKIQASQGWLSTTPAHSYELRAKHDTAMFRWARARCNSDPPGRRPILIAGHTHHPVFPGSRPPAPDTADGTRLESELARARKSGADVLELAKLRARAEGAKAAARRRQYPAPEINDPPCYFNGGCCCYPDGDVTCLELDGPADEIRLMRWPRDRPEPDASLAVASLRSTFGRVNSSA